MVAVRNLWSLPPVKLLCVFAVAGIQKTVENRKAQPHQRRGSCQGAALGKVQVHVPTWGSEDVWSCGAQRTRAEPSTHITPSAFKGSLELCFIKIILYFFGLGRLSDWWISCRSHAPGPKTAGVWNGSDLLEATWSTHGCCKLEADQKVGELQDSSLEKVRAGG